MIVETFLRNEYRPELVYQLDHSYDIRQIRSEVGNMLRIEQKLQHCPSRQLMLSVVPGAVNPCHYGCGTAEDPFCETSSINPSHFTEFNPKYRGYYLDKIWQTFPYKIGRMFVVHMYSYSCLALSKNSKNRLVLAVDTSPHSHFLFEDKARWYHVPVDEHLYFVNAKQRHTIYNGADEFAVYLMFELLD